MAISKNALLTAGLMTFGISLAVATGPYGLAFAAALLYSSIIALALTAVIYGIAEGNIQSNRGPTVVTPLVAPVVHTKQFVPAGGVRVLPTVGVTPTPVVHTKQFVPAPKAPMQTHTRHFEPAAPTSHSRTFLPAAGLATTSSRAPTAPHPATGATSHTRTFIPRQ